MSTPIEQLIKDLRQAVNDPAWREFDKIVNDTKNSPVMEDLEWLVVYRSVAVLLGKTPVPEPKFSRAGHFVTTGTSLAGERVIIHPEVLELLLRKSQRVARLAESVMNWIELSRKDKTRGPMI